MRKQERKILRNERVEGFEVEGLVEEVWSDRDGRGSREALADVTKISPAKLVPENSGSPAAFERV